MPPSIEERMALDFCGLRFKNPLLVSSGTFGNGVDFFPFLDTHELGGVALKALTLEPRKGHPYPRVCETEAGMLNAIGLQNGGWPYFETEIYPKLHLDATRVIVNIAGHRIAEYVELIRRLKNLTRIDLIELNVSCPNVEAGKILFGADPKSLSKLIRACVKANHLSGKPLLVKLSPNVTSITEMAMACQKAGADGLSIANTFVGMRIDIDKQTPMLKNVMGGYSGPGIKPIVLRMVYEASQAVNIPIIAIGGVVKYHDVVEYLLAGASLVSVGTANLIDPGISVKILKGLKRHLIKKKTSVKKLTGGLQANLL